MSIPTIQRYRASILLATLLVHLFAFWLTKPIRAQNPGTHHRTMQSDQQTRQYRLHIPPGYQKEQKEFLALVVMLHGRSSNGQRAASRYYGWTELADKERFIAAFPTVLGSPTRCKGAWPGQPTPDSQFLSELIDLLITGTENRQKSSFHDRSQQWSLYAFFLCRDSFESGGRHRSSSRSSHWD